MHVVQGARYITPSNTGILQQPRGADLEYLIFNSTYRTRNITCSSSFAQRRFLLRFDFVQGYQQKSSWLTLLSTRTATVVGTTTWQLGGCSFITAIKSFLHTMLSWKRLVSILARPDGFCLALVLVSSATAAYLETSIYHTEYCVSSIPKASFYGIPPGELVNCTSEILVVGTWYVSCYTRTGPTKVAYKLSFYFLPGYLITLVQCWTGYDYCCHLWTKLMVQTTMGSTGAPVYQLAIDYADCTCLSRVYCSVGPHLGCTVLFPIVYWKQTKNLGHAYSHDISEVCLQCTKSR